VTDVERIAALEERVAACEEYIAAWLILEDARRRARERGKRHPSTFGAGPLTHQVLHSEAPAAPRPAGRGAVARLAVAHFHVNMCRRACFGAATTHGWTGIRASRWPRTPAMIKRRLTKAVLSAGVAGGLLFGTAGAVQAAGAKTFVGPADDPFFIDLGSVFDGVPVGKGA
jgi:hypothetical protein